MKFQETTLRILVRKNYGACFDFYTEKLGLTAVWGDRNGPYTSFAVSSDAPPCFAIFAGDAMSMFQGYTQPQNSAQPDTVVAVIPTLDLDGDYFRLKEAGGLLNLKITYTYSLLIHCLQIPRRSQNTQKRSFCI